MTKKKVVDQAPLVAKNVKNDDLMTFTFWAKVKKTERNGEYLTLVNVDNQEGFNVQGITLVQQALSADQSAVTETLPRREVIDVLIHSERVPFTVAFVKADGNKRVLRGRLIGVREVNMGYVDVEDLDQPVGDRFRQVDTRTVEFVIVGNRKLVVK